MGAATVIAKNLPIHREGLPPEFAHHHGLIAGVTGSVQTLSLKAKPLANWAQAKPEEAI
ncbi:hypothetical protein HX120_04820 [Acinetobacter indicus]|nr:hypothetical protein [Acinetobacter indicus]